MNLERSIVKRIQQTRHLSWGEFYPDKGLMEKAGVRTTYDFAEKMGIDFLSLPPSKLGGGDLFGRASKMSNALMTREFPVKCMKDLEQYEFPAIEMVLLDKRSLSGQNRDNLLLLEGPIQLLSSLMPFNLFMMSLVRDKRLMLETITRYFEWLISITKKAGEMGISGVVLGDDIAGVAGLMMSPKILDAMYFPFLQQYISQCELPVFMHSDGDVRMVIPSYIQAGAVGLQSIEREAGMHIEKLVEDYPEFLFWGGISREAFSGNMDLLEEEAFLLRDLRNKGARVVAGSCTGILDDLMIIESLNAFKAMIKGK